MSGSDTLEKVLGIAASAIGLDRSALSRVLQESAVAERSRYLGLAPGPYTERLLVDVSEQHALCQLLLVSESWFFREPAPIRAALRALYDARKETLAVLSAPCARGEEVISTFALALEAGFSDCSVFLDGYDASRQATGQAREFRFGEYSFRGAPDEFRTRFFERAGQEWLLRTDLRRGFRFFEDNLTNPAWSPVRSTYDLVLCRNLLIYLSADAQRVLLAHLQRVLAPDGLFVVSAAEATLIPDSMFRPTDISPVVFRSRDCTFDRDLEGRRMDLSFKQTAPLPVATGSTRRPGRSSRAPQVKHAEIPPAPYEATTEEAFSWYLERIEGDPRDADAHFMLGVIACASGELSEAKCWIEKALAIDPSHEDARLYLDSLFSKGDSK